MDKQREVDEVTRAILYPWVRESLEMLAVLRDDMRHDLASYTLPIQHVPSRHIVEMRLRQRIARIDQIISDATGHGP